MGAYWAQLAAMSRKQPEPAGEKETSATSFPQVRQPRALTPATPGEAATGRRLELTVVVPGPAKLGAFNCRSGG